MVMSKSEKFPWKIQIATYERWEEVEALGPCSHVVVVVATCTVGALVCAGCPCPFHSCCPGLSPLVTLPGCLPPGHLDLLPSPLVIPELAFLEGVGGGVVIIIITNVYQGPPVCLRCTSSSQHGFSVFCAANREALGFLELVPLTFVLSPKALSGTSSAWMGIGHV